MSTSSQANSLSGARLARGGSWNCLLACWLVCLASCLLACVSLQVVSLNQESTSGSQITTVIETTSDPMAGNNANDLNGENNNLIPRQQQQQQHNWKSHNSIATPAATAAAAGQPELGNENNLLVDNSVLERRLDRLEFELRKSMHQIRLSGSSGGGSSPSAAPTANQVEQVEAKYSSLVSRLELLEKFIATTTKKLYETEQRVRQLEKCDCRLSCKWDASITTNDGQPPASVHQRDGGRKSRRRKAARGGGETLPSVVLFDPNNDGGGEGDYLGENDPMTSSDNRQSIGGGRRQAANYTIKADGESWKNNCDVCSCHRGHVKCRHIACPALGCPDPRHVPGKCCPVCYKSCMYKEQKVGHGNKLVINSNQDTCKECLCLDGRLRCQRVELDKRFEDSPAPATSARQQRSTMFYMEDQDQDQDDERAEESWQDSARRSTKSRVEAPDHLYANLHRQQRRWRRRGDSADDDQLYDQTAYDELYDVYDSGRRRTNRAAASHLATPSDSNDLFHAPLVCPQIDCPPSEQMRLKNDCCTYCKHFDFCSHVSFKSRCHPDASCVNLNLNNSSSSSSSSGGGATPILPQAIDDQLASVSSMFACQCKSGFTGDGQYCRDINECADRKLNDCDPKTTTCVNLPGSYECKCKRGYKFSNSLADGENQSVNLGANEQMPTPISTSNSPTATVTAKKVTSCQDVNECQDGKLNRCHPQAKCVNLSGSYKCRCRRGYLGNGLECHQWFSSDPNVAAYLYRHSSSSSSGMSSASGFNKGPDVSGRQFFGGQHNLTSGVQMKPVSGETKINLPLDSLDDPDDDRIDRVVDRYEFVSSDDDDDNDNVNIDDDYDDDDDHYQGHDKDGGGEAKSRKASAGEAKKSNLIGNGNDAIRDADEDSDDDDDDGRATGSSRSPVPKLSESQWQPLKFGDWTNLFGGGGGSETQQPANQISTSTTTNGPPAASNNNGNNQIEEPRESLNTRTMFFQPPPRYRKPQAPAPATQPATQLNSADTSTNRNYVTGGVGEGNRIVNSTNQQQQQQQSGDKSDTNDSAAAKTGDLGSSSSSSNTQPPARQTNNAFQQSNQNHHQTRPLSSAYQQPTSGGGQGHRRGTIIASATTSPSRSHYNVRMAHSSSLQNHKSKAYGVSSSAAATTTRLAPPFYWQWTLHALISLLMISLIINSSGARTSNLLH